MKYNILYIQNNDKKQAYQLAFLFLYKGISQKKYFNILIDKDNINELSDVLWTKHRSYCIPNSINEEFDSSNHNVCHLVDNSEKASYFSKNIGLFALDKLNQEYMNDALNFINNAHDINNLFIVSSEKTTIDFLYKNLSDSIDNILELKFDKDFKTLKYTPDNNH